MEQVAWARWQERACSTCTMYWRQLYFDDARTLGEKWDFIKQSKLLGTGLWAAGFEDPHTELYKVMREKFLTD